MSVHQHFRSPHWSILITVMLGIAFISMTPASAADDPVITSVEPALVQQGDTVLLTITGENFPTGSVVVEFFPQQIALLDVLSSSATEVVAQIKVPSLAQPGKYNILIYNQLGEELFAEGLLEISSQVITPVLRDYQPKTIGDATAGFALLLTGESITPEVIDHLTMQWSLNGTKLDKLTTIFSYGTHGQILCAVTGNIPGGSLQGRINLDGKPIYMVEVQNQTVQAMIVGQQPTVMSSDQQEYLIRLLGTDFSAAFVAGLALSLETETLSSKASKVEFIDGSTFTATFLGPLPSADYTLLVKQAGEELFIGNLLLTVQEVAEDESAIEEFNDQSASDSNVDVAIIESNGQSVGQVSDSDNAPPQARIVSLAPEVIPPGNDPASFAFTSTGLTPDQYERLAVKLRISGQDCQLLFIGAGRDSCTCMFAPPDGGWVDGAIGDFAITDPQSEISGFTSQVRVSSESEDVPVVDDHPAPAGPLTSVGPVALTEDSASSRITIEDTGELAIDVDLIEGLVAPDSLNIELQTSAPDGFVPDQVGIGFDPDPANPNSAYFKQEAGGTVRFLIDLTAWNIDDLAQGLTLEFHSSLDVDWVPDNSCYIPNQSAEPAEPGALSAESTAGTDEPGSEIILLDQCRVDNGGFELVVNALAAQYPAGDLENLKIDTDDGLLKINLDKFTVTAVSDGAADGENLFRLSFTRDDDLLDEIAYWLLMDNLIEGPGARITLEWPGLHKSASTEVRFVRDN